MKTACCISGEAMSYHKRVNFDKRLINISKELKERLELSTNSIKGNIWLEGLFGIEKENIRVDTQGHLSQTPHPKAFGNKLKHPFITTDFSESQIEMRTPPLPEISQTIGFLETNHDIISLELNHEYLWPQSIPPVLPEDHQIPIASYEDDGQSARAYREQLAQKYGPKTQLFSGIHFNFSFSEKLLRALFAQTVNRVTFDQFKDEVYLKVTRQLLRLRWLYVLLYGNSPVVDSTMELRCKQAPYKIDQHVIGLSIRNSCYGYQNLGELFPDYTSVKKFKDSVEKMITDGQLSSPRELYSPVRLKFIQDPEHISYIELRFIDIDPLERAGISEAALNFLHILALYGLLTDEPDLFEVSDQQRYNNLLGYVALSGLSSTLFLNDRTEKTISVWKEARTHLEQIERLFERIGIHHPSYQDAIRTANLLIDHPEKRKVFEVLSGITKMGYIPFHLNQAQKFLNESKRNEFKFMGFEDLELSTQLVLREAVKRGVAFEILDRKENFIRLSQGRNVQYIKQATKTSLDNYASVLAMENKQVTKSILHENGIRVPSGETYTTMEQAKNDYFLYRGKSIVIKPNQTNFGIGITMLRENLNQSIYERAIEIAFENDETILIEEYIEGKEYRFFVIENEVVAILHRVPANITGDGIHSIKSLVEQKNHDPLRGEGYRTPLEKIRLGEAEKLFLTSQQKNFDSIPAHGEIVFLRENSNISTGGDSIDMTDQIPDSYKQIALKAAKALNVKITGLDMIIEDQKQEADNLNYSIIEMNFNPAIHIHCHPYKGTNRKLNAKMMDALGY